MLLDHIAARRSPRAFDADAVLLPEELASLLEAARWAPSAMNRQPWFFLVGQRGDATFKGIFDALRPGNQRWAGSASALIVAFVDHGAGQEPDSIDPGRAYELGLAVGQLGVQAQHLGLIAHQMGGFDHPQLRQEFAVPAALRPMVVIAVGSPGDPDALSEDLRVAESAERSRTPVAQLRRTAGWS
jgi:nitroreductase